MTVIPALERELVAAADRAYSVPRQRRLLGWPTLAASSSAVAAALVGLVLLLSSGAPDAFAGWTGTPSAPTQSALTEARAACGRVPRADLTATESRGPFTAIVYLRGGTPWQCVTRGNRVLLHVSTPYPPNVVIAPAAGKVSVPIVSQRVIGAGASQTLQALQRRETTLYRAAQGEQPGHRAARAKARSVRAAMTKLILGAQSLTAVTGSVGPGVSAVTFVLRDGTRVKATVGHGWYIAWWPGVRRPGRHAPTAVRVTTVHGTTSAAYPASYLAALYKPCLLGQTCPNGQTQIKLVRSVAPSITEHFGLFRNTPPAQLKNTTTAAPSSSPAGPSLGLDESQTRRVAFGNSGTIWVTPGTEGACVKLGSADAMNAADTGGGGCSDLREVLAKGLVVSTDEGVFGLVADGNPSVSVCMTTGRRITIPVKDNVFYRVLPGRPGTIYLENAYGKPTHQLIWVSRHC
jgi:hypothetical protein